MSLLTGKIGLIGATGVVGRELIGLFQEFNVAPAQIILMASERSVGQKIEVNGQPQDVVLTCEENYQDLDLVFFCASSGLSRDITPKITERGITCIDLSSAFRMNDDVPLVVPEVNAHALNDHCHLIANPNCSTIIMLLPLAVLDQKWGIKRVVVSTYQAASGAGLAAMQELENQTQDYLDDRPITPQAFKYPIAFNLFSHDSAIEGNGFCGEENKMILETRKILGKQNLHVMPTTIRVPVLRAHSESIYVEFENEPDVSQARELLKNSPGITLIDDRDQNRFPMPMDVSGKNDVAVGRLRSDPENKYGLLLFVAGDQIRKGAALNALQIAQLL